MTIFGLYISSNLLIRVFEGSELSTPDPIYPVRKAFKDCGFRVETSLWKKGDEIVDALGRGQRRTFTFLADKKEEKELWLYQIR